MNSSLSMPQANPLTPMAYLPPSLANEVTLLGHVTVAAFSIQLWDMLNHIKSDYTMSTLTIPTAVYFVSRISSLGSLLAMTLYQVMSLSNCDLAARINAVSFCIAIPSTSLLFYLRLRAMYKGCTLVILLFFLQWLLVIVGCSTFVFGAAGIRIGPTDFCLLNSDDTYLWASALVPLLNDSFIFIALSWRLMSIYSDENINIKDGARTMLFGYNLPAFSRGLLHDGQIYYLTTVGLTFITVVTFYVHSIPPLYRLIFGTPNIAIINIMACRVYRKTKLGYYRQRAELPSLPSIAFSISRTAQNPMAFRDSNRGIA